MGRAAVAGIAAIMIVALAGTFLWFRARWRDQASRSPYAGQLDSPIRGLSPQEVDDLRGGRGAGFARTAELNGYPGPRHVLDLRAQMQLAPAQVRRTEAIFAEMEAEAKRVGDEVLRVEARLSDAFARGAASSADVEALTGDAGRLYGQLRAVHLRAHLQMKAVLSAGQVARYNEFRGYRSAAAPGGGDHQHRTH
ncbi:MAG: hypothetical protein HY660_02015 [Armatimonadetes bacterium]|nr:hypothetical protein [Armatimonadota bacterium]